MSKENQKSPNSHNVRANSLNITCKRRGNKVHFTLRDRNDKKTFSTGVSINSKLDTDTFTVYKNPAATSVIQDLKSRFYAEYYKLELAGLKPNLSDLKALVFNRVGVFNVPTLFGCFDTYYTNNYHNLLNTVYRKGTVVKCFRMIDNIKIYFLTTYQTDKLQLSDVRKIDGQNLVNFCRSNLGHEHNHANRHGELIKRIMTFAVDNQWIEKNPLDSFRTKRKDVPVVALNEDELDLLIKSKLEVEQYEFVQDVFLFCCFTGLSYADIKGFNHKAIKTRKDGQKVYITNRDKNQNRSFIPLVPQALEVIEKYQNHPYCLARKVSLPVFSNAYMNRILKQIMVVTGIKTHMTTHVARKTCASYFINNGVPIQSVSAMLGHRSIKTTENNYYKRSEDAVIRDFQELENRKKGN